MLGSETGIKYFYYLLNRSNVMILVRKTQFHLRLVLGIRKITDNLKINTKCTTKSNRISRFFGIDENKAHFICLKHPLLTKLDDDHLKQMITTAHELGYRKEMLIEHPLLLSMLPITFKYRHQVLIESGLTSVSLDNLRLFFPLVKQTSIKKLKEMSLIPVNINVENKLASHMTMWPTSLTTLIMGDSEERTLYQLRLKIIQRYLELNIDLSEEEFNRGIKTYPTIKHRPLTIINETLSLLLNVIMIPKIKIRNNLYLVQADAENVKQIIYSFRTIAGVDIKEILRLHPKITMKNVQQLREINQIMSDFNISLEAQRRCFEVYSLGLETIRERLIKAKQIPEFAVLFDHPRFLKMIYYNNSATERLRNLYSSNKKCLSLNILAGSTVRYKMFEKSPGDRSGKGKDVVFYFSQLFKGKYSSKDIRKILKRHQFWLNVPLVQVKYVFEKLNAKYSEQEIYDNCVILLYPWSKIRDTLMKLSAKVNIDECMEQIDCTQLSKSQELSLVLYILEKNCYFSGNGIWTEERMKNVVDLSVFGNHRNLFSNKELN